MRGLREVRGDRHVKVEKTIKIEMSQEPPRRQCHADLSFTGLCFLAVAAFGSLCAVKWLTVDIFSLKHVRYQPSLTREGRDAVEEDIEDESVGLRATYVTHKQPCRLQLDWMESSMVASVAGTQALL